MSADSPTRSYADLGPYSDIVAAARAQAPLFPTEYVSRHKAQEIFKFTLGDEKPHDVRHEKSWTREGVDGEEISWSVGFGPRTHALLLKPTGARGKLPGVVALYDHGNFKFFGKEKIADGPDGPFAAVQPFRDTYYSGRPFANALAREGFAVLAHDTFLFGSRKFPIEAMPELERSLSGQLGATMGHGAIDADVLGYHGAAYLHENQIAKYLNLLGTSFGAVTTFEDRVALNYLGSRDDIDTNRIGCIGFSGGGLRASLLGATSDRVAARSSSG